MNPFLRFFIRFLKIFFRSLFKAATPHRHDSSFPEQDRESYQSEPASTKTAPTEPTETETTTEQPHRRKHRRTSVTETTTRTTTISESQSSPDLTKK